jgi:hypothetical protein
MSSSNRPFQDLDEGGTLEKHEFIKIETLIK